MSRLIAERLELTSEAFHDRGPVKLADELTSGFAKRGQLTPIAGETIKHVRKLLGTTGWNVDSVFPRRDGKSQLTFRRSDGYHRLSFGE